LLEFFLRMKTLVESEICVLTIFPNLLSFIEDTNFLFINSDSIFISVSYFFSNIFFSNVDKVEI
jgi:hypothetical protein